MTMASDSFVDRAYDRLRRMAIDYQFKPGERLNEVELSRQLGLSRTPLREALNRLTTEGFLRFSPGKGFFCRQLDPKEIYDLYQLRKALEVGAVKLSVRLASETDIESLGQFLSDTGPDTGGRSTEELVALDEAFHERLMALSGNNEMRQVLRNVNAKIQFVRWVDMDRISRPVTQAEHRLILERLKARDEFGCIAALEKHIDRRQDQITAAIKERVAQIYMPRGAAF
ncbi:GntR family transcriptional regulator [Bradyrhizobium diazoefficiens]|nr:GntR family transcriptional regulator [Bradyrhizobium diazoefficiens]QQO23701.1 GntR family transcriptional regulator [Bradyrhizobium diazoefficiens]